MAKRRTLGRAEPEGRDAGPQADPVEAARDIALRQLSTRARTRAELERVLASRGVPVEAADEVLDRFEEVRLVDDASFATAWVESRQRGGRSERIIRRELGTKGVDAETIADALASRAPDADYEAALAFAQKRAGSLRGLEANVRYRRLGGALARRGFSSAVVGRVLRETLDHQESLDSI